MISMKMTPAEANEEAGVTPEVPAYPYGLTINLEEEQLAKLGITSLPPVGTVFYLKARTEVTSTSQYQNQTGTDMCLCLQITDMELDSSSGPSPEERAAKFYAASGGQSST